jgi:hypothetical protein
MNMPKEDIFKNVVIFATSIKTPLENEKPEEE